MPIKIPEDLPARPILEGENIFVMTEGRANRQDIRPLEIAIVNLMPTKIATETQLLRLLGNTPLQVNVTLLRAEGHESKNTAPQHLERFYKTFSQVRDSSFDGMIITGAPVEQLAFEEVDYWDELVGIMDYAKKHVHATLYICWGAQAGLYHHYGIPKYGLPRKLSGIFSHTINDPTNQLFRGFDDVFHAPHSRHTEVRGENHDVNLLQVGSYPYYLKQRILGNKGHLSNEVSGKLINDLLNDNVNTVLLGHLSKENNYDKLAFETVRLEIDMSENGYKAKDFDIEVAKRSEPSRIITL